MASDCQEELLITPCVGSELQKGYLWAWLNSLFAFSSEVQSAFSFQTNLYIFYQLFVSREKLDPRSGSGLPDIWCDNHLSLTLFNYVLTWKEKNNNFSHISDEEGMIYKNLPDYVSFNHFCKQVWRLIRVALISRNYASPARMPLPWLHDSVAVMEVTFIKSKLERSLAVHPLPLTREWPWLNSLWWHQEIINGLIQTAKYESAVCPGGLETQWHAGLYQE